MTTHHHNERVSVIVPAYNSEAFLEEAIESVLSQTYADTECVVVDDGSTDGTASKAKGFGSRVTYVYQENAERSAARNTGIGAATGGYICFLDADDFYASNKLHEQVEFLKGHPEYDVVYSNVRFFRGDDDRQYLDVPRRTPDGNLLKELLYGNFITVNAPLFRKSAVIAAGGFDSRLSHNEDWEFFLRIALGGARFGFLDRVHSFCRFHDSNTSRDEIRMHKSKWEVVRRFVAEHLAELTQKGIVTAPVLAFHEADYGKALIANGQSAPGRRHIFNACRHSFPKREKYLSFALLSYLLGQKASAKLGGGVYRSGGSN